MYELYLEVVEGCPLYACATFPYIRNFCSRILGLPRDAWDTFLCCHSTWCQKYWTVESFCYIRVGCRSAIIVMTFAYPTMFWADTSPQNSSMVAVHRALNEQSMFRDKNHADSAEGGDGYQNIRISHTCMSSSKYVSILKRQAAVLGTETLNITTVDNRCNFTGTTNTKTSSNGAQQKTIRSHLFVSEVQSGERRPIFIREWKKWKTWNRWDVWRRELECWFTAMLLWTTNMQYIDCHGSNYETHHTLQIVHRSMFVKFAALSNKGRGTASRAWRILNAHRPWTNSAARRHVNSGKCIFRRW